jgi:lysophospholipase L1-like esterase
VLDHEPRVVIYMCGCNDLYRGESAARTVEGFLKFVDKLHAHLSDAQLIFVSVINSPLMVPPCEERARAREWSGWWDPQARPTHPRVIARPLT